MTPPAFPFRVLACIDERTPAPRVLGAALIFEHACALARAACHDLRGPWAVRVEDATGRTRARAVYRRRRVILVTL